MAFPRTASVCFIALLGALAATQRASADPPVAARAQTASPYVVKVQNGGRLALAGDYDGAIAALTEAVQLDAANPAAFYLIGVTKRLRSDIEGALEAFRTAARLAAEADDTLSQARAMQAIPETLERVPARLEEARVAWVDFARFADAHRTAANPEVGRARVQAILRSSEVSQAYAPVRERIAERERTQAAPRRRTR